MVGTAITEGVDGISSHFCFRGSDEKMNKAMAQAVENLTSFFARHHYLTKDVLRIGCDLTTQTPSTGPAISAVRLGVQMATIDDWKRIYRAADQSKMTVPQMEAALSTMVPEQVRVCIQQLVCLGTNCDMVRRLRNRLDELRQVEPPDTPLVPRMTAEMRAALLRDTAYEYRERGEDGLAEDCDRLASDFDDKALVGGNGANGSDSGTG